MREGQLHWIANYIWGIADDVLRDLYVRGKYRDVILPMTVLHRLDAVLEASKEAVRAMKATLDQADVVEQAAPVVKKVHSSSKVQPDPLRGLFAIGQRVVEYEPDSVLRDSEQIPLTAAGGIEAFLTREVLPYAPDAWYVASSVKIGYEISFTRHFYKPQPMRPLAAIRADILAVEGETQGLLGEIVG